MERNVIFGDDEGGSRDLENSGIVIVPVPYDKTSTWMKGADKGPFSILEASPNLEFYDIETDREVFRKGIYTAKPVRSDASAEKMSKAVRDEVLKYHALGKFVVLLGGEHSVSIGAIQAFALRVKDLTILQLDAHADLREEYEGSKFNHACVMARAREICPIVQVGIRSMSLGEKDGIDRKRVFLAEDIAVDPKRAWMDKVINRLTGNVYVTIDLDVFDPSIMPSTGTPEPGGLGWYDVTALLRKVAEKKNIVGFDCVELCPNANDKAPDFLAAKLVYKLLSYVFASKSKRK
ncbi:MAG: agmatinase [Candidatus Omnitrophica bacterium]|nr:agmatinase [Candidatus Omnitrophota bacterium]